MQRASKPSGGAAAAQAGYGYQLNVSVLAALRLLLITKSASRITLEPANEEDLEADLTSAEPGRVRPSASLASGYKLVVQVKFRGGEPWSIEDFDNLLRHGERRTPAKQHLDDPDVHYLLVTNADAKGVARNLLVSDFEEESDPSEFPSSLNATLPHSPEGRVAIWGSLTERLIELEIGGILSNLLRVPHSRQVGCFRQLRREARRKMSGNSPGVWTRDDLLATIRAHGGYLASAAELATFVEPSNFGEMASLLQERNAIVITGPSGSGKTLAAIALCDMLRRLDGRLDIVPVNPSDDPSTTRRMIDTGPTLFYVEDPWGQYSLRLGSDAWTEQLPRLLRDARPDRRYVVTSRSDMLNHARADQELKRWSIELNADHYGSGVLAKIFDKRMDLLATDLQSKALEFRKGALDALATPLELDLFFTHLADGPQPGESDRVLFQRLLGLAHRDAVESVVVKYLGSIDKIGPSAVIWCLLAARGKFDRTQLVALQRQLRKVDAALGDDLGKVVDRLIATRHLRQPSRAVSFAHPSVRAGFETFLKECWLLSESAFERVISALTGLTGDHRAWGLETAARALHVATNLGATVEGLEGKFEVAAASQEAIDAWLDESLVDSDAEFSPILQLAADVGSATSNPCELARWFIKGWQRGGAMFIKSWNSPTFSDTWFSRISSDQRTVLIADRFVREMLPQDYGHYGNKFVTELDRIATDLTPSFLAAAHQLIGTGHTGNVTAIAAGAIRDIREYEAVLAEAIEDLARLRRSHEEDGGRQWRAIEDGEYDAWEEEYYSSQHDDEGYASGVFIDTFVVAKRSSGRWRDLANHTRVRDLARSWARDIQNSDVHATSDEVVAILDVTLGSEDEEAGWDVARLFWHKTLADRLEERIILRPGDERLRRSLVHCACAAAPAVLIKCFKALELSPDAFVHLLVDVYNIQGRVKSEDVQSVLSALNPEAVEAFNTFECSNLEANPVGARALALLEEASNSCGPVVLSMIVPVMIANGLRPADAIHRWLTEANDSSSSVAATDAAIAIGDESVIGLALDHVRADARRAAFEYLAPRTSDPLPEKLLSLATDRGSRVRRSVVGELSGRPLADHLPVLMHLMCDQWSDIEPHYDALRSYPIAREAVAAIAQYEALADTTGVELLKLAKGTDDRLLARDALAAAANLCGPDIRRGIWGIVRDSQLGLRLRVDAIDALSAASIVEIDIVAKLTADTLMKLPPPLAVSATVLVGTHLPAADATQILERVGHSHSHRALLLLGAAALQERDCCAALGLLGMLGVNHPARRLLESRDELVPRSVLDDLGDVRIRKYVHPWFSDRIAQE